MNPDTCKTSSATVDTPSRLVLFLPSSTPGNITALLPAQPVVKSVGQRVILGRAGSADVRLNDERMSRQYVALWQDGLDPFVFRVSNLSERKVLLVNGAQLRHLQEAEVKDGSELILDFLQLQARVYGGDYVTSTFEVHFVKTEGFPSCESYSNCHSGCFCPGVPGQVPGDLSSAFLQSSGKQHGISVVEPKQLVRPFAHLQLSDPGRAGRGRRPPCRSQSSPDGRLGCYAGCPACGSSLVHVNAASLGVSMSPYDNVRTELRLNIPPEAPMAIAATHKQPYSFDPASRPAHKAQCPCQLSSNPMESKLKSENPDSSPPSLHVIAQHIQDALIQTGKEEEQVYPTCKGETSPCQAMGYSTAPDWGQREALADLVQGQVPDDSCLQRETEQEWDTDDPNINCYMK